MLDPTLARRFTSRAMAMNDTREQQDRVGGVSAVVPVFDELENLEELHERLVAALSTSGREWEIVYVDDGSTDGSTELLGRLAVEDEHVTVVELARNFGQTAALAAGLDEARLDVVVTLDADLQNDPADIETLVTRLEEGADVASGWRRDRRDPFVSRVLPSLVANALISRATGVSLHDYGCTLKAYRRRLFDEFRLYGEMHRFVPAWAAWAGARVAEVPVAHHPRRAGSSKYGIGRTWRVILDLLTVKFLLDFGTKPLHVFGAVGLISCVLGVLTAGVTLLQRHLDPTAFVHRNPLILLAVLLFLLGVQSIMLGLLAELAVRIYHEVRGGAPWVIARTRRAGVERRVARRTRGTSPAGRAAQTTAEAEDAS